MLSFSYSLEWMDLSYYYIIEKAFAQDINGKKIIFSKLNTYKPLQFTTQDAIMR